MVVGSGARRPGQAETTYNTLKITWLTSPSHLYLTTTSSHSDHSRHHAYMPYASPGVEEQMDGDSDGWSGVELGG